MLLRTNMTGNSDSNMNKLENDNSVILVCMIHTYAQLCAGQRLQMPPGPGPLKQQRSQSHWTAFHLDPCLQFLGFHFLPQTGPASYLVPRTCAAHGKRSCYQLQVFWNTQVGLSYLGDSSGVQFACRARIGVTCLKAPDGAPTLLKGLLVCTSQNLRLGSSCQRTYTCCPERRDCLVTQEDCASPSHNTAMLECIFDWLALQMRKRYLN